MKEIIIPNEIKNNIIKDYIDGNSVLSLSKKYEYSYDKLYSTIVNNGLTIRGNDYNSKKYYVNSNAFDEIDTEEKAYWLGFLYADGCVMDLGNTYKISLALSTKDLDHLKLYHKFLQTNYPIHTYFRKYKENDDRQYSRLAFSDKHMGEQLIKKGVYVRKTEIITFPEFLDNDMIRHFIRGYVDGDGCITYHRHKINKERLVFALKICSTKEMLNSFAKYLPSKNKNKTPKLQKRRKNSVNNYSLEYGGNIQVLNILNYLYKDSTIYLKRKYERYLLLVNLYS